MPDSSLYFSRTAVYAENGGEPAIVDVNNPQNTTPLGAWFGVIIQLADGEHTLDELHQCIAQRYQGNPPPNLNETLTSLVERLLEGKLLALSETPIKLPYYLSQAIEYLDIEKAKKAMKDDGLTLQ